MRTSGVYARRLSSPAAVGRILHGFAKRRARATAPDAAFRATSKASNRSLKHGVRAEDIEALFREPIVFAGRITEPVHNEPRWLLLGRYPYERPLALIFARPAERLRPISCRRMRRKEQKVYEDALEGQG